MNQWQFFTFLFDSFDLQFLAAVQTNANNLLSAVQVPLIAAVSLYIASTFAIELYSPGSDPLLLFARKVMRAALVIGMVGAANYTVLFETLALTTLPNEITAAMTGAATAGALTPIAFDKLLQGGWVAVAQILKNLSVWDVQSLVLGLLAAFEYLIGAFFIAIGFLVFIASHIMLGLAITVGPLFVCMLLWEKSVYLFNAWISTLLALIVTQVLVVALLSLLLTTETNILTQITSLNGAAGLNANDIGGQVHYLIEAALLYFMIGYLSPKVAELAQSLTTGAAPGISAISQVAHNALGSAATSTVSAAASGARSAGAALGRAGAAGMRSITPAEKAR